VIQYDQAEEAAMLCIPTTINYEGTYDNPGCDDTRTTNLWSW
jgi:hypothetical protein